MARGTHALLVGVLVAIAVFVVDATSHHPRTHAATATSRFVPVTPCRLADERTGLGLISVDASTARIDASACGIPDEAASIVVSTTIVNPRTRGWLVAFPSGAPIPTAATLNWNAGSTRANSATVALGADGHIAIHRKGKFGDGNVLVDVVGAFVPADTANAGRFEVAPVAERLLDTRADNGAPLRAESSVRLPLPDGVPTDAVALAVNLTVVDTRARGFFSLYPAGTERPTASVLNADAAAQTRAAATIVPVNDGGFDVFTKSGAHVIVDMTGWFTGASAPASADGLFVAINPDRLRDTRLEPAPVHPRGTIETGLPDRVGSVRSVALSITMVAPVRQGYITAHAARTQRGPTSSGFGMGGEVTAQFAITAASTAGVGVYAHQGAELTVDLLGWFTGSPVPRTEPQPASNTPDVQRVIAIGDSSLAGIDRNRAWAQLRGADFDLRARSCRRLIRTSCRGLEGPTPPPNTLEEIRSLEPGRFDIAVIMAGYNEGPRNVAAAIPLILEAARAQGVEHVIWMTHARAFRTDRGGGNPREQVYAEHNAIIRRAAAANSDMTAVEWGATTRQVPFWVYPDGIHLDKYGSHGAADFISRAVAFVAGQRCPVPEIPGGSVAGVCRDPGTRPPVDIARLYGV
ncbi:MAG: SGNH/GDSL hydrolase family protein [Ilumatobacter sp.]